MKYNYFLLFLCILFSTILNAQISRTDNSEYFDDGGISNASNIVEFNILSAVNGDIGITYDRKLSDSFSAEVGLGFIAPYYTYEFRHPLWKLSEDLEGLSGYSLKIQPKFYVSQGAPEDSYIGILLRYRNYNYQSELLGIADICVMYGTRYFVDNHICVSFELGFGLRNKILIDPNNNFAGLLDHLIYPGSIKVGYLF
jgi:hypothetical protein